MLLKKERKIKKKEGKKRKRKERKNKLFLNNKQFFNFAQNFLIFAFNHNSITNLHGMRAIQGKNQKILGKIKKFFVVKTYI